MGVVITKQEEIDAYYASQDLNQSLVKTLIKGMDDFLLNQAKQNDTEEKKEKPAHFLIGSGVDCKLTAEEGVFEQQYHISEVEKKPSDTEVLILNTVWEDVQNLYTPIELGLEDFEFKSLDQYPGTLKDAIEEHQWYGGKPGDKRIAGLIERGTEYFEDLKKSHGKDILSKEQADVIDSVVMSLTTHPRTRHFFDRENQSANAQVDYYYQLPIYFEYEGVDCKALLDLVIVVKDEAGKIVSVQPIDLKTMSGKTIEFSKSVRSRRYDIQAAWYTYAIISWLVEQGYGVGDVVVHAFQFIVESTTDIGSPLVYTCTGELLHIGLNGRDELKLIDTNFFSGKMVHPSEAESEIIVARKIKGFAELVDDYLWYQENGWTEEKVVQESEGVLQIGWNGII